MAVLLLAYIATWIGGAISGNDDLKQKAQQAYREAERRNKEKVDEARQEAGRIGGGVDYLLPLHDGGPIVREWCWPLLPGVLVRHWESSIGPQGGGGGSSLELYYLFGSTKFYSFGGWRH